MLRESLKTQVAEPENPILVRVQDLGKWFGRFRALDGINFQIFKGEILGLLGPNGAGKTTVIRILAGFFPPTKGRVWIGDEELFRNPQEAKKRIGYLPETVYLYRDMRVIEFLNFVSEVKAVPRSKRRSDLEDKLDRCGLWDVRTRLIGHLSKGYRQRLGLAQALIGNPDVLLLDEPTSGLDPKQIIEIRSLIRELGKERTLILSTHILPEVSTVCDRVLILNQGKVAATGTAEELAAGIQARHEIFVVLGERHRKEEAIRLLSSINGIDRVSVSEERGDRVHLSLTVSRDQELRPEISRLCVQHHIPLLELRSGSLSLEDIFLKLVVKENSPNM